MCVLGYVIVGLALLLFVQARNVYPQLLLARLFFSIGGAATSTMVTAILPSMITPRPKHEDIDSRAASPPPTNGQGVSPSISSEITITPQRLQRRTSQASKTVEQSPTRLAGIVGLFTGCGALLALGVFLRLPELIQRTNVQPGPALADSYYIVGALSLVLSVVCFIGLRHLSGEDDKGWRALVYGGAKSPSSAKGRLSSLWSLFESIMLGFKSPLLGLGYLGGFVARASSVGISLFIPLFVNAYYMSSGLCDKSAHNPQDIKDHCRGAYVLAAELTGVSQLVALVFAPVFGILADRFQRFNAPLLIAAFVGTLGYVTLAVLDSPMPSGEHGSPWVFFIMALLGISQIGAIVCSLGLLGRCVLGLDHDTSIVANDRIRVVATQDHTPSDNSHLLPAEHRNAPTVGDCEGEDAPLLRSQRTVYSREHLKGSIAGVYSLAGGIGILLLTKVGGVMFDKVSPIAPFAMLAGFNLLLLIVGAVQGISMAWKGRLWES